MVPEHWYHENHSGNWKLNVEDVLDPPGLEPLSFLLICPAFSVSMDLRSKLVGYAGTVEPEQYSSAACLRANLSATLPHVAHIRIRASRWYTIAGGHEGMMLPRSPLPKIIWVTCQNVMPIVEVLLPILILLRVSKIMSSIVCS